MKKLTIISGFMLAMLIWFACNKVKQIANINVDIPYSLQVTIPNTVNDSGLPSLPGGTSLSFPPIAVATNSSQYLAQYHTSGSKIVTLYLKAMSVQFVSPPEQNFDFLDSAQLFVSANNLPEVLVAYDYNIPRGQNTLNFYTLTNVNLKDYFLKDTIYFRLNTHINALPPVSNETLNCNATMHLTANPLE